MAVTIATKLHAVAAASNRLKAMLQSAGNPNTSTSSGSSLPTLDIHDGVDNLLEDIDSQHDQAYKFAAVETAARDIFYTLITSTSIDEPEFSQVWDLLDILLLAGDKGKCAPELVVWLVEELLDSQTTEGCRTVFDYLESRRERLAQKDFHKKNLVFLRSCNELLRRLSRAEDATFCGRVFFFLFQTFPLGDKSSVNLRGEFHVENTTSFDESAIIAESAAKQLSMTLDAAEGSNTPTRPSGMSVRPGAKPVAIKVAKRQAADEVLDNNTLYPIFWRLQQAFSVPTKLFQAAEMQLFKQAMTATLAKFKKTPAVVQNGSAEQRQHTLDHQGEDLIDSTDVQDFSENYNPKYLTSRELFDLELTDQAFRRHISVQGLILLNFLLSLAESTKQKLADIEHPNKSMLYDFTLDTEDTTWAVSMREAIKDFLKPHWEGRFYERMVDTILSRDKNWIRWKVESCPSIVRDAMSVDALLERQDLIQRSTKSRRIDQQIMGAMDLDFLDDARAGGLDALRNADRYNAPTTKDLVHGIDTDMLDLDFAQEDERASLDNAMQNKTWRLVRDVKSSQLDTLVEYEASKAVTTLFGPRTISSERQPVTEAATV